ncbi:MAG: endonuclease, partial [Pseudarthrobacter sp.]|nr:endonuclease [Pseudarthrobacter sp.]
WNRLTALARGMQGPDEARTLTQLKADNFTDAILGSGNGAGRAPAGGNVGTDILPGNGTGADAGAGPSSWIRAHVLVTVPVYSLLGITDEPANLDGYGPIPPSMARRLVADGAGSFYRVLVDPQDRAPLEIGRTSYRVSKAMRQWLRLRDGKCPFPGCNNPSLDNEADHILAWANGGSTGISNLGQPCPKHHKLRHTSGWKPTPASKTEPPGWTSPTGRHYKSEHQDWEPPHWPQQLKPGQLGRARFNPSCLPPDFVYGPSPGEEELERFLHGRS